jgi:hypothetical protein
MIDRREDVALLVKRIHQVKEALWEARRSCVRAEGGRNGHDAIRQADAEWDAATTAMEQLVSDAFYMGSGEHD